MKKGLLLASAALLACVVWAAPNKTAADGGKKLKQAKQNAVLASIFERRCIRNYKADAVPAEDLQTILKAGIYAPSALNRQDWALRVVDKKDDLKLLRGVYNAPVAVLVANDGTRYGNVDSGLLAQNMQLAAHSLGIGSCVIGSVTPVPDQIKAKLDLPEGYDVAFAVILGYPDQAPSAKPRDESKIQFVK